MATGRNPMLGLYCKKTDKVDIVNPIYNYCLAAYGTKEANAVKDDLETLQEMRNQIVSQAGSPQAQKEVLIKYYRGLLAMETRFPISRDKEHAKIYFTWYDAFRTTKRSQQSSIHLEKAGVLFNLSAVCSQISLNMARSEDEGVKAACKHFQEAAGFLATVKDDVGLKVDKGATLDIGSECCSMLERLLLAQAQECFYEKAFMDKKSPSVLSMIAKQVTVLYNEVKKLFNQPILQGYFEKTWGAHAAVKAMVWEAESYRQSSQTFDDTTGIGSKIARLRECKILLDKARKETKFAGSELAKQVEQVYKQVSEDLLQAEKDNNAIYLSPVLLNSKLPAIKPAPLAKVIAPDFTPKKEERWFVDLIPDNCTKALSRYSELVDDAVREMMDKLERSTDDARIKLKQLELPETLDALNPGSTASLPDFVKVELEEYQNTGGISHLKELMSEIAEIRRSCENQLQASESKLGDEAREDEALRTKYGPRWRVPASNVLTGSLREKIASYRANLQTAAESDQRIQQKFAANEGMLASLNIESAAQHLPRLQAPMVAVSGDPAMIAQDVRRAVAEMNTLAEERAGIEEAIKELKERDNILPKLMSQSGPYDELFEKELAKYKTIRKDVESNADRTQQLIVKVEQSMAQFNEVFQVGEWKKACDAAAQNVKVQVGTHREIRDNLQEGLSFYMSLQEATKNLYQCCEDFAVSRKIQADDMEQQIRQMDADAEASERKAKELQAQEQAARQQMSNVHVTNAPPQQQYPMPAGYNSMPPGHTHSGQFQQPPMQGYYQPPPNAPQYPPPGQYYGQPPQQHQYYQMPPQHSGQYYHPQPPVGQQPPPPPPPQ
eukprot:TRINITY_DN10245_c0_g5_i1.p1 TRINITY_DN10245_c0_g5~~TRINITY_DN10245_c0_g5_i1.p1  ORF type:complete len:838 (-),score=138.09 TRINITY_DN10245_c0_g5_i1:616-3129(-)